MVDLSVIILTRNNKKMLDECASSVMTHTGSPFELIVTDNGSSDGTVELIRSKYPSVKLIENKANLGFTVPNNKGLKIASGRYAVILNDDTYLKEDAFSKVASYLDAHPDVAICGPRLLNPDGSTQTQGSFLESRKWRSTVPIDVSFVIGACMFIRMSALGDIGMFDENLFFYNDDLDICMRARKAGYRVVYAPVASVFHYGGSTSKKTGNFGYFIEGVRGGLYFCRKHYGPIAYMIYRGFVIAAAAFMSALCFLTYPVNKGRMKAYSSILKIALKEEILSKNGAV